MEHNPVFGQCFDLFACGQEGHLRQFTQQVQVIAAAHRPCDFGHRLVAHAVNQQVGTALDQYRRLERIAPVVVVCGAPQRCFDAADDDRRIGIELLEDAGIDCHDIVGPETRFTPGRVGVVAAQPLVGRIMVHHRVHRSARDAEEEARPSQFAEVAQVVLPIGLRHDGYSQTFGFEQASDHRCAERRVVDVGVSREEDYVEFVPSPCPHLLERSGQPVCRFIGGCLASRCMCIVYGQRCNFAVKVADSASKSKGIPTFAI